MRGKKFGRWTVLHYVGNRNWQCRCECGTEKAVAGHYLRRGVSASCGCLQRELVSKRCRTHGAKKTTEWRAWCAIKQRCFNPKNHAFKDYGARGITMCAEWRDSFEAFLAHVGHKPSPELTIERIDNNRGYEPGNVRWATRTEQEHNKRSTRLIEYRGTKYPLCVLARMHGLLPGTLADRLDYGWSIERAVTSPVRPRRAPCLQQSS